MVVIASFCLNAALCGVFARTVYRRGGAGYLTRVFAAPRKPAPAPSKNPSVTEWPYWLMRKSLFAALSPRIPAARPPIVFVGDSLTGNFEWTEYFRSRPERVVGRGIAGDTTEGLLSRIDGVAAMRPRAVFIMMVVNDPTGPHLTPAQSFDNYKGTVAKIAEASPATLTYMQSVLPVRENEPRRGAPINGRIRDFNARVQTLANGKTVFYVDLAPEFVDANGDLKQELTFDGIHLTGEGYAIWMRRVEPLVNKLLAN